MQQSDLFGGCRFLLDASWFTFLSEFASCYLSNAEMVCDCKTEASVLTLSDLDCGASKQCVWFFGWNRDIPVK